MKLKPLDDRVIIEQSEADEVSKGGIVLPENAKEKPTKGKILAVGPGKTADDGKLVALTVKVGDLVLYEKYGGTEVQVDGEKRIVVRESEILAIIE